MRAGFVRKQTENKQKRQPSVLFVRACISVRRCDRPGCVRAVLACVRARASLHGRRVSIGCGRVQAQVLLSVCVRVWVLCFVAKQARHFKSTRGEERPHHHNIDRTDEDDADEADEAIRPQ